MKLEYIHIIIDGVERFTIPFNEEFEDNISLSRRAYELADEFLKNQGLENIEYTIPFITDRNLV